MLVVKSGGLLILSINQHRPNSTKYRPGSTKRRSNKTQHRPGSTKRRQTGTNQCRVAQNSAGYRK